MEVFFLIAAATAATALERCSSREGNDVCVGRQGAPEPPTAFPSDGGNKMIGSFATMTILASRRRRDRRSPVVETTSGLI